MSDTAATGLYPNPMVFQSRFGGLWTDLTNAHEVLEGRLALGYISEQESELLKAWINNGYVIMDGAVSHGIIDAAMRDIAKIYESGLAFVETYEYGDIRLERVQNRHRAMAHKLIDAYALSDRILGMVVADKVVRFLNMIFDAPAMAFQGLYFETGSQQDIHQDTAYVRVNRPMALAASWIAMEDVQEGSGELEYYVGSHRIPEFLFGGNSKWMPHDDTSEHQAFLAHLHTESRRLGLRKERFHPKKGDVLIWNADLCHGGAPITNKTTRRSFVSHWCPVTTEPYYYNTLQNSGKIRATDQAYYTFAYHGHATNPYRRLSATDQLGLYIKKQWQQMRGMSLKVLKTNFQDPFWKKCPACARQR